ADLVEALARDATPSTRSAGADLVEGLAAAEIAPASSIPERRKASPFRLAANGRFYSRLRLKGWPPLHRAPRIVGVPQSFFR
ncbi:MAG: hypothetical protein WAS73_02885, partial [Defluviicoccus sp.]